MLLNVNKQFVKELEEALELTLSGHLKGYYIFEDLNKVLLERIYYDNNVMHRTIAVVEKRATEYLPPFKVIFNNTFLSNPVCSWIESLSIKEHIELIQYVLSKIGTKYY
jgi:hypothetical protein